MIEESAEMHTRESIAHACFSKSQWRTAVAAVINFRKNLGRNLGSSCSKADRVLYLEAFANTTYTQIRERRKNAFRWNYYAKQRNFQLRRREMQISPDKRTKCLSVNDDYELTINDKFSFQRKFFWNSGVRQWQSCFASYLQFLRQFASLPK